MESSNFPVLLTERLILNQPTVKDGDQLVLLLNESPEFSENTLSVAYPYSFADAEFFLNELCINGFKRLDHFTFAIRLQDDPVTLVGVVGLTIFKQHHKAEAGYWLGKSYQRKGLMTEALTCALRFAFENLQLNKVFASHFPHNLASGKVMQRCGMKYEGLLRQEFLKGEKFIDLHRYAAFKQDFQNFS